MKRMIVIAVLAIPAFTFAAAAPKVTFEPAAKVDTKFLSAEFWQKKMVTLLSAQCFL